MIHKNPAMGSRWPNYWTGSTDGQWMSNFASNFGWWFQWQQSYMPNWWNPHKFYFPVTLTLHIWNLKFAEMLNTALLSVLDWQNLLHGKFECSYCAKIAFFSYLIIQWPWPLDLKRFRNASHCHNNSFLLTKVATWCLWSHGSKSVFSSVFGHIVTLLE